MTLADGDVVELCIDTDDWVSESDETNNCVSETFVDPTSEALLPDLTVDSISIDPVDYSLDIAVRNMGSGDVGEDADPVMNLTITLPDEVTPSSTDFDLESYVTEDADFRLAGETMVVSMPWANESMTFPEYCESVTDEDSTWDFGTLVDSGEVVLESDETNNIYGVTFNICADVEESGATLPDFFVSDVYAWQFSTESFVQVEDIPAESDPADYVLYFDVSNQGTDATVASLTDLKLDLCNVDCSTATLPPYLVEHDFAFLGDSDVLTSGGTSTDNAEEIYTGEVDVSGVTTFEYCVDESDYLLESDESNNCISFDNPFFVATDGGEEEVTYPDLVIESVTLNADNTLHFVVSNQGTGTVDTELLVPLYFYDQTNGDGTPDDSFYLNDYGSDYATVGGTVEFDSMYAVPGLPVTILAVVDPANDVVELTDDVFESNYYRATFGEESSGGGSSGGTVRGGGSSHHSSGGSSSSSTTDTTPVETTSEEVVLTEEEVAACGEMTFTDVTVDTEGYDAIYQLWCEGVLHGRDAEHFAPNDEVKRDEATKIVTRLFGFVTTAHEDLPQVTETSYSDVSTDEALAYYIETATDEGFFTEEELVGEFRPHEDMTYSEAQSLLTNASGREVTVEGYEATDTMTRGVFVDLVLGFFQ